MKNFRIQFLPGKQKQFLDKIINKSGLSIKEIAKIINIHPRTFFDWRRERMRMTFYVGEILSKKYKVKLPESKEIMIQRWGKSISLAAQVGGFACYKKYGEVATEEGRKRGGKKSMTLLRQRGIIPERKIYKHPEKSASLAEFVGIMLGDGGITPKQCAITLNREADADYLIFVSNLCKDLLGEAPKTYFKKKEKGVVLYYNGIDLVDYLVNIGLKIGNKVKQQVYVPLWVKERIEYKIACLRGLMDTDGGLFPHRYTVNKKSYSYNKISFTNRSIPLLLFVYETLKELGLGPKLVDKIENKKVWLYNTKGVEKYFQLVSSHNQRLLRYI